MIFQDIDIQKSRCRLKGQQSTHIMQISLLQTFTAIFQNIPEIFGLRILRANSFIVAYYFGPKIYTIFQK